MAGRRRPGGNGGGPDVWDGTWDGMILDIIYGHYEKALDALPLEDMPALAQRLLDAGVCFGFADPVTNIIANTVCFVADEDWPAPGEPEPNGARKRKRKAKASGEARATTEEVLSNVVAGDAPSPPEARTIAERSLEGLVTFLTSYFRYLLTRDAMRYLCLAQADLLVAVKLIEHDRCCCRKEELGIRSHATNFALKCAAVSARQPNIDGFITGSFGSVCHLDLLSQIAPAGRRLSVHHIRRLSRLLVKPFELNELQRPIELAGRLNHCDKDASIGKVPHGLTESLRSVLLDKVHAVYLKSISRLPVEEFRIRHHRGLLKAGYCFGPFSPVSNIIVNTIWYDTAFPAVEELEVDMVIMTHVESRSLDGLIKLLLACIPEISELDAMVYLLKSKLKLHKAIEMARQEGHVISGWDDDSYKAAADAAYHPEPEAYVDFVMHSLPMVRSDVRSLLKASPTLSPSEALRLSRLLSPSGCNRAKSLEPPVELTKDSLELLSSHKEDFLAQQNFIRRKIEAALQKYEQTEGHRYDLHIICGVNENVGKKRWIRDLKRQYSHANFWASLKDETSQLFFAEFSNDEDSNNHQSFCCPVSVPSKDARCCYCDFEGTRIVHPIQSYCGGAMDFEKMACGEHKITNDEIISHGNLIDYLGGISTEDYIYLDPARDTMVIREMNRVAGESNLTWEDEMKMMQQDKAYGKFTKYLS